MIHSWRRALRQTVPRAPPHLMERSEWLFRLPYRVVRLGSLGRHRGEINDLMQSEIVHFGLFQFRLQPIGVSNLIRQWKSPFIRSTTSYSLSC